MVTFEEYLKNILRQVDDSNTILENLRDKPGDLEIIRRELAKINGLLSTISSKLESNKQELSDYQYVLSPIRKYLENYEFFREMDTLSLLYSDDSSRLKNLRLAIIGAIKENNLLGHIQAILKQ